MPRFSFSHSGGRSKLDLAQAETWLGSRINHERSASYADVRLGLEPIRALLDRVGNPQHGLRALHIAGSKGKGSVALIAESVCREAGVRTGTFTSPHLVRWTERFRIDGREVSGEKLVAAVERIRPAALALDSGPEAPTWFDITTAIAFLLFAEAEVDLAILEVGLGGRLDSTNVVEPMVCCIASIELEHTERLGTTHDAIAREKAGILKSGIPGVVGRLSEEALAAVEECAAGVGAPLVREGVELDVVVQGGGLSGSTLRVTDGDAALDTRVGMAGPHQAHNAALALACVRRALPARADDLLNAAARVLPTLQLPGRIEVVGRSPWRIVDAAHTPASARVLMRALSEVPRERGHLVLAISAGKDLEALCGILAPGFDSVTITRAEASRSLDPGEIADALRATGTGISIRIEPDVGAALSSALQAAGPGDLVCATGSFYLAGPARGILGEESAAAEPGEALGR